MVEQKMTFPEKRKRLSEEEAEIFMRHETHKSVNCSS